MSGGSFGRPGGRSRRQLQRGPALSAMTGGAVRLRVRAPTGGNLLQVVVVDRVEHLDHFARDLFGRLLVRIPDARLVAVRAVHAEGGGEAKLHDAEEATRGHSLVRLDVVEEVDRELILLSRDE